MYIVNCNSIRVRREDNTTEFIKRGDQVAESDLHPDLLNKLLRVGKLLTADGKKADVPTVNKKMPAGKNKKTKGSKK